MEKELIAKSSESAMTAISSLPASIQVLLYFFVAVIALMIYGYVYLFRIQQRKDERLTNVLLEHNKQSVDTSIKFGKIATQSTAVLSELVKKVEEIRSHQIDQKANSNGKG